MAASVCHPSFGRGPAPWRTPRTSGGGEGRLVRASMRRMGTEYEQPLDVLETVRLFVEFATRRDEVLQYALILVAEVDGCAETIRVYDAAHGCNEMHRYTKQLGKQPATVFHR